MHLTSRIMVSVLVRQHIGTSSAQVCLASSVMLVYSHCGGGDGLSELVSDICRSGIPCIGPTVLALSAVMGEFARDEGVVCLSMRATVGARFI